MIDTKAKRWSCLSDVPQPDDSAVDAADRVQFVGLFCGRSYNEAGDGGGLRVTNKRGGKQGPGSKL